MLGVHAWPTWAVRALLGARYFSLTLFEPIDALSRRVNGKTTLPPLNIRRSVGPLGNIESSGGEFAAYVKLLCDFGPREQLLDIGCGFGLLALYLEDYVQSPGRYVGIDISRRAVRWAQRAVTGRNSGFEFVHLDIANAAYNPGGSVDGGRLDLPFPDQSFDVIVLKSVFTHLHWGDTTNYLSEIRRLLRRNGRCLATFFLLNDEQQLLSDAGRNSIVFAYGDDGPTRSAFRGLAELGVACREDALRDAITGVGLKLVRTDYGSWSGRERFLSYQDIVLLANQ